MRPIIVLLPLLLAFPAVSHAQEACGLFEAVEPGDTLAIIATRCGVSEAELADNNTDVDPANLVMGSVVTIQPFETTPQPEQVAGPSSDAALSAYRADVRGRWSGQGGTCASLVGSWTFDNLTVRGNATIFEISGVSGTADRMVVETTRRSNGATVSLTLRPSGDDLAVTGPDLAADLMRCPN